MPRIDLTYGQLMALRDDIQHQRNTSASFYYLQKAKVERFRSQNKSQLELLKSRLNEFIVKYVKHDENNQPMTEDKDGTLIFVFDNEENKESYVKAQNHFLSLKTHIKL